MRFNLWKPSLEARTGVKIEQGRMYVVRGRIEGVGEFESRHVGSASPHVYVFFRKGEGKVVPGERYLLLVEAIEEKRRFEVLPSSRGPCIRVTRPVLEGLGVRTEERSVVELVLRRAGEESGGRRAYARWEPDWGFMQLYLRSAGFAVGEKVQVVEAGRYPMERFVGDFWVKKVPELANVELGCCGQTMTLKVDGRDVPVEECWLGSHGLKAVLKVKFGQDGRMLKFEFDGQKCEARLMNSDRIMGLRMNDGGLGIRYARTASLAYTAETGIVDELKHTSIPEWLTGRIRIVRKPSEIEGVYWLAMEESLRGEIRRRLREAKSADEYNTIRGDIAEGIVGYLSTSMGFEKCFEHPFPSSKSGSRRWGPDFLTLLSGNEDASYLEVKWWKDVVGATLDARDQVTRYFVEKRFCKGYSVTGAYIAVLDWETVGLARLVVEKVKQ